MSYQAAYRTTFRLLRTNITIDLLFPCKQIIRPRFLHMQLTLLKTNNLYLSLINCKLAWFFVRN
jgi:hypothetical protein